jgi:hypothetical protein
MGQRRESTSLMMGMLRVCDKVLTRPDRCRRTQRDGEGQEQAVYRGSLRDQLQRRANSDQGRAVHGERDGSTLSVLR